MHDSRLALELELKTPPNLIVAIITKVINLVSIESNLASDSCAQCYTRDACRAFEMASESCASCLLFWIATDVRL